MSVFNIAVWFLQRWLCSVLQSGAIKLSVLSIVIWFSHLCLIRTAVWHNQSECVQYQSLTQSMMSAFSITVWFNQRWLFSILQLGLYSKVSVLNFTVWLNQRWVFSTSCKIIWNLAIIGLVNLTYLQAERKFYKPHYRPIHFC